MGYELMDKAIEELNGILPEKNNKLTRDSAGNRLFALADGRLVRFSSIAFENRAKELGWINGYKYGIEYPTNGKKPDLPNDVLVEVKFSRADNVWYKDAVGGWRWLIGGMVEFRIVDGRYKPVSEISESKPETEDVSDKSWHERVKFPPANVVCEAYDLSNSQWVKVKTLDAKSRDELACVTIKDEAYGRLIWCSKFRPIKTERDVFIEAASLVLAKNPTAMPNELLGMLYDADFRAPKTNKEQNDVE